MSATVTTARTGFIGERIGERIGDFDGERAGERLGERWQGE
jgi:hypothetical protein